MVNKTSLKNTMILFFIIFMTSLMGSGWLTAAPSGLVAWNKFSYLTQFPEVYIRKGGNFKWFKCIYPTCLFTNKFFFLFQSNLSLLRCAWSNDDNKHVIRLYLWNRFNKPSIDLANDIQLCIDAFIFNNGTSSL